MGTLIQLSERVKSHSDRPTVTDFSLVPQPFTLTGEIRDNLDLNMPKCDPVRLEVIDGPDAGRTITIPRDDGAGDYSFPDIHPGVQTFRATAPGYSMRTATARVRGYAVGMPPLNGT